MEELAMHVIWLVLEYLASHYEEDETS